MKLRPFEIGLVAFFAILFSGALLMLKFYTPPPEEGALNLSGPVVIWGTLPDKGISTLLFDLGEADKSFKLVSYRYIPEENFDNEFVNALADQKAPDVILMSQQKLVEHRNRLQSIPYASFPIRDFRDIYIEGAEIFALTDGIYAYPVAVDPLVMYWNRDTFSSHGFLTPPKTWEEIVNNIAPAITERDFNRKIIKSAMAMGENANIKNAFPILSMLLLQSGSALVSEDDNNKYRVNLNNTVSGSSGVFVSSLRFFTNFSSINNTLYNWNRTLPLDQDAFLREDLAIYFGFGSEARNLESKNPNISFDIAEVPQGASSVAKRTYGNFYGFFTPKTAKNKQGAYLVMQTLGNQINAKKIADSLNLAPAHKILLQAGSNDVYGRVIYSSAFNARGWLNPDLDRLNQVFTTATEDISANRKDVESASSDMIVRLGQIY